MSLQKSKWLLIGFTFLFGVIYFTTYYSSANDLPRGIHQWAQADRLALCYRFVDGKPLTQPATLSIKTADGDVGVEFSVFQYALAQIVRLGFPKSYLPFLYKFFTFSFFFVALGILCTKVLRRESVLTTIFSFIILISSPILIYYGYNYLPDVLALGLVLFALLFFHKGISKHILVILLISGLSLFMKASSGVYFIAFYSVYFLQNVRKPSGKFWLASLLFWAIGAGVAYYDYYYVAEVNKRLWSTVFLSSTMAVNSWAEFWNVLDVAWRFKNDYFTTTQRWFFILIPIGALLGLRQKSITNPSVQLYILLLVGLTGISILFGIQFMNHDYYVISTLAPALIYLYLRTSARYLPYIHPTTAAIILGIVAIFSYTKSNSRYYQRMSEIVHIKGYPEEYAYKWLLNSEKKIAQWVSQDEPLFVCYAPEPNHSLVYLNRKGATFNAEEMGRDESPFWYYKDVIKPKCMVIRSTYKEQLIKDQPKINEVADQIFEDQELIIYQFKN